MTGTGRFAVLVSHSGGYLKFPVIVIINKMTLNESAFCSPPVCK